ncbi:hypothetical protein TNIN_496091 [Trichonephila inaurata madagascariensis]|uniref:Uncharacterized protein n=1 Tax=Trichonephila inaurata madagascariensis TaxID=2747483 RepID=A0A8X6MKY9_9ARAC|nr:hypothetical protein TNIN_496091 [Trichonephila inaurata madagascariensis]
MAPASTAQLLHKIVHDEPYEKSSRKKNSGFPQHCDLETRNKKILKDFSKTELITVCIMLSLNCAGNAKELNERIFKISHIFENNFANDLTGDNEIDSTPFFGNCYSCLNKQRPTTQTGPSRSSNEVIELSPPKVMVS